MCAEETVDGIEGMQPGGDTMKEGETDAGAGAEKTIAGEAGIKTKRGEAETGMREEEASPGKGEGAEVEVGTEETLMIEQEVGGAGMRKGGEVEEAGIAIEEEAEAMRSVKGAERRGSRKGKNKSRRRRKWVSRFPSTSSQEVSSRSATLNRLPKLIILINAIEVYNYTRGVLILILYLSDSPVGRKICLRC